MMKLWSRLSFLVLAISSLSRGENGATAPPDQTPPPRSPSEEAPNETARTTPPTASPQSDTSANATALPSTDLLTQKSSDDVNGRRKEAESSTQEQTATPASEAGGVTDGVNGAGTTVSIATGGTSSKPASTGPTGTAGYVFLFVILLMIVVLCVILYFLRRASRSYSFDLHRPAPANHHNEPIGNFEPVYLDDLDRPAPKDEVTTNPPSPPPVSNGTTLQSEELISNGESGTEKAPQNQPDGNGLETSSPSSNTSPSLGHVAADNTSSSTNLLFDAIGEEQQNENNNNNPSVSSSEPFVEINLDEPAWCDELLTSSEAPSSVLPFSPFSLSSISSS